MKSIFNLSHAVNASDKDCIANKSAEDAWQCNFAMYAAPFVETPIFFANSQYDTWSVKCILSADWVTPHTTVTGYINGNCTNFGWTKCYSGEEKCTSDQIDTLNDFAHTMRSTIEGVLKKHDGAWIGSCFEHGSGQTNMISTYTSDGYTLERALTKWWQTDIEQQSSPLVFKDCFYSRDSPHQCNPSCNDQDIV
jgi:hypothetical protein